MSVERPPLACVWIQLCSSSFVTSLWAFRLVLPALVSLSGKVALILRTLVSTLFFCVGWPYLINQNFTDFCVKPKRFVIFLDPFEDLGGRGRESGIHIVAYSISLWKIILHVSLFQCLLSLTWKGGREWLSFPPSLQPSYSSLLPSHPLSPHTLPVSLVFLMLVQSSSPLAQVPASKLGYSSSKGDKVPSDCFHEGIEQCCEDWMHIGYTWNTFGAWPVFSFSPIYS